MKTPGFHYTQPKYSQGETCEIVRDKTNYKVLLMKHVRGGGVGTNLKIPIETLILR